MVVTGGGSGAGDWREEVVGQTALVEGTGATTTGTAGPAGAGAFTIECDDVWWPAGDTHPITVSVFCPGSLYRISGLATATDTGCSIGVDATVERIQRRRWPRRKLDLAVTLCPVQQWTEPAGVPGRSIDLSVGGMCVECMRPLPDGSDPMVVVYLPDGTEVVANTVTVGVEAGEDHWRYHLAFRDLDGAGARSLAALIDAPDSLV